MSRDYANEVPPIECIKDCLNTIKIGMSGGTIDSFIKEYEKLASRWDQPGYSWSEGMARLLMEKDRLIKFKEDQEPGEEKADEVPF